MRRLSFDHPRKARPGARMTRFAALDRRPEDGLTPLFERVFRRARARQTHVKLTQYLAISRRS